MTQNAQQTNIKQSKLLPQLYWGHSVEARSWTFNTLMPGQQQQGLCHFYRPQCWRQILNLQHSHARPTRTGTVPLLQATVLKADPQPSTLSCQANNNRDCATSTGRSVEGRSSTFKQFNTLMPGQQGLSNFYTPQCWSQILNLQHSHARTPTTGTVPLLQATDNSQPIPLWSHCLTLGDTRQHAEKRSGRQTFLLGDWPGQRLAISEARLLLSFSLLRGWKRHG